MADEIGNNSRTSFSLMNPDFVCGRSTVASVWRRNGERHLEACVQPTTTYNGVMVWTGINCNGRTALVVGPGNLTGRQHIDEILRPRVVPYLRQINQNAIFQDDNNARPHRARTVDDFLRQNGVERLE